MVSAIEEKFRELLEALPKPDQYSLESVIEALGPDISLDDAEDEHTHRLCLPSGFDIFISKQGKPSLTINKTGVDADEYPALMAIARKYASKHHVSLESYFFSDTNSGMFGFDTLDDARQVDVFF